jgi:hypothetical protein
MKGSRHQTTMWEVTASQKRVLERLAQEGFCIGVLPPYESALCVCQGNCGGLVGPAEGGGLRLLAAPSFLIEGHLSAKLTRGGREWFVWKGREMEATPERQRELVHFQESIEKLMKQ